MNLCVKKEFIFQIPNHPCKSVQSGVKNSFQTSKKVFYLPHNQAFPSVFALLNNGILSYKTNPQRQNPKSQNRVGKILKTNRNEKSTRNRNQ
jgi:hypothetical protein